MPSKSTFDEILDKASSMSEEDQDMIIEILRNRSRERRRDEILRNYTEALEEHKKGLTSAGSVKDLLKEMGK